MAGKDARAPSLRVRVLLEPEVSGVDAAVVQCDYELAASPGPRRVGLPDVDVLVGRSVVREAAASRVHGLHEDVRVVGRVARDRPRRGRAGGEDVEPLVAAQGELDRDGAARVDDVEDGRVRYRLEEAVEVVAHRD